MSKDAVLYGIIGLLAGIVITTVFAANAVNNNMGGMMRMMGMRSQAQSMMEEGQEMMMDDHDESMSMQSMVDSLKGKSDDEFDKTFIDLMIEHHQGAIDMASEAKINAKHQEIKDLAVDITTAQTNEIEMMRQWQKTWGY